MNWIKTSQQLPEKFMPVLAMITMPDFSTLKFTTRKSKRKIVQIESTNAPVRPVVAHVAMWDGIGWSVSKLSYKGRSWQELDNLFDVKEWAYIEDLDKQNKLSKMTNFIDR